VEKNNLRINRIKCFSTNFPCNNGNVVCLYISILSIPAVFPAKGNAPETNFQLTIDIRRKQVVLNYILSILIGKGNQLICIKCCRYEVITNMSNIVIWEYYTLKYINTRCNRYRIFRVNYFITSNISCFIKSISSYY